MTEETEPILEDDELDEEEPLTTDNEDGEDGGAVERPDPSPRNDKVPDPEE